MTDDDPLTSDIDGAVMACPHCDRAGQLYERAEGRRDRQALNTKLGSRYDPFVCYDCGETFKEPVERPSKHNDRTIRGRPTKYKIEDQEFDLLEFDPDL